jgi:3-deoxy-D-manno-oct-2-ulosonic acid (Kdo) hydroxylase
LDSEGSGELTLAAENQGTLAGNPQCVSRLIEVTNPAAKTPRLVHELESGNILFFPRMPFPLSAENNAFLLAQKQTDAGYHKNIAYRPVEKRLTGTGKMPPQDAARLKSILAAYSDWAAQFLGEIIPEYSGRWTRDFASFRPIEEKGRAARLTARNDLAHVDAFPTRPTHGDRILRLFTNINPTCGRVWITSETFEGLAQRFARQVGIPRSSSRGQMLGKVADALGLRQWARSPYDAFMLRFHDFLKQNGDFQRSCLKQQWEFPPGSCWICYTDMVSHAVLSGRFALEQTFLISRHAMALPEKSPIRILERICGHPLSN